jgi:DNA-binding transcriptional MerR regulator
MVDSQTLHALRDACSQPGCPICNVTQAAVERYISGLFYESILDPISRRKLRNSLGLCQKHARLVLDAGLSDALGLAILYEDLVGKVLELLPVASNGTRITKNEVIRSLETVKPCTACVQEKETSRRYSSALGEAIIQHDFQQLFQKSNGLCLPHLREAIEHSSNQHNLRTLLDLQSEKVTSLRQQLAEFIRKNDYRFRDEAFGEERDSYRRAIEMIAGLKYHKPD